MKRNYKRTLMWLWAEIRWVLTVLFTSSIFILSRLRGRNFFGDFGFGRNFSVKKNRWWDSRKKNSTAALSIITINKQQHQRGPSIARCNAKLLAKCYASINGIFIIINSYGKHDCSLGFRYRFEYWEFSENFGHSFWKQTKIPKRNSLLEKWKNWNETV